MSETAAPRPRVLYVLTSRGKGTGGHHFSLRDLTQRLRAEGAVEVHVAVVANHFPPSLAGMPGVTFIPWAPWRLMQTLGALLGLVRRFRATHLHSYDSLALQFGRVVSVWTRLPLVHTQCGGPTPRRNVPRAPDVVVFSEENRSGLAGHPRMAGCRLHLIASRVNPVVPDPGRIEALRRLVGVQPGDLVILRINRFVDAYALAMEQTLAVGRALRDAGQPVRVILLGSVGDEPLAGAMAARAAAEPWVSLVHAPEFTHNAAALLPVADAVVGTGRGLMEAASLSRVVFAPVAERAYPALLAPDTVEALSHANFSPRARLDAGVTDDALRDHAVETLREPAARARAGTFARHLYETRFDVGVAAAKHREIYAHAEPWPLAGAPEALADLGMNVALESFRRVRRAVIGGR